MQYNSIPKLVIFFILILSIHVLAQNEVDYGVHPMDYSRVGTSGWQFLKIPTDARSAAMGGTKSAIGYGDANAAFGNPASASDVGDLDVRFTKMTWVADIEFISASVVKQVNDWGTFGFNIIYLNYGDMIRTANLASLDHIGIDVGIIPITEGLGSFTAHDLAIGFLYSRRVTDKLQLGGNIKYLQEKLDDALTGNWSIDIGLLYYTGLNSLRISMLGKNFGPDAEFSTYDARIQRTPVRVRMPMLFVLGAAYDIIEPEPDNAHGLIMAAEYLKPNDGPDKYNLGVEYSYLNIFFLRAGYRVNYDEESFTLGGGIDYTIADAYRVSIDYSLINAGIFNEVHMFTVGFGL